MTDTGRRRAYGAGVVRTGGEVSDTTRGGGRRNGLAVAALVAATMLWAGNFLVAHAVVGELPPVDLVFLRWAGAAPVLLLAAQFVERPDWGAAIRRSWAWILVLAATGMVAYALLLYGSLAFTDPVSSAIINAANPALIVIGAAVFLGERLSVRGVAGIVVAFVGVVLVLTDGDLAGLAGAPVGLGELLMLGAIAVWAAYTLLGRRAPAIGPTTSTALQSVVAAAVMLPVVLLAGGIALPSTPMGWVALAYLVLGPSVGSYLLWNWALTRIPAGRAGVSMNLITVFTVVGAVLVGTVPSVAQAVGGLIVLGGVTLTMTARTRARERRHGAAIGDPETGSGPGRVEDVGGVRPAAGRPRGRRESTKE